MANLLNDLNSFGINLKEKRNKRFRYPFINTLAPITEVYKIKLVRGGATGNARSVIDGDTFYAKRVSGNQDTFRFRLIGIDAPEIDGKATLRADHVNNKTTCAISDIKPLKASQATQTLAKLMGAPTGFEYGKVFTVVEVREDEYNRKLGIIFDSNKDCVDWELLKSGDVTAFRQLPMLINADLWNTLARNKNATKEKKEELIGLYDKLVDYLEDIEAGDIDDREGRNLDDAIKIGLTWLPISVKNINVVEQNANIEIPTIRTPGSPVIKTNKLNKRIELNIVFPSIKHMNSKLRPLVAQFIRSPFLPIEEKKHHIWNLIYGEAIPRKFTIKEADSWSEVSAEAVYDLDDDRNISYERYIENADKMYQAELETLLDKVGEYAKNVRESRGELDKYISDNELAELIKEDPDLKNKSPEIQREYARLRDAHKDWLSKEAEANNRIIESNPKKFYEKVLADLEGDNDKFANGKRSDYDNIKLVVALQEINVATIPGLPQTVQCTLLLNVFNYSAFSPIFKYCASHRDALLQAEYYNDKSKLENEKKMYYTTDVLTAITSNAVSDISESNPFKDYIRPLLTGRPISIKYDDIKIKTTDTEEYSDEVYESDGKYYLRATKSNKKWFKQALKKQYDREHPDILSSQYIDEAKLKEKGLSLEHPSRWKKSPEVYMHSEGAEKYNKDLSRYIKGHEKWEEMQTGSTAPYLSQPAHKVEIPKSEYETYKRKDYVEKTLDYSFWAPDNWLRPIKDDKEFEKFIWELDVTDLNIKEENNIRISLLRENKELHNAIKIVTTGIKITPDKIEKVGDYISATWYCIERFIEGAITGFSLLVGDSKIQKDIFEIIKSGYSKEGLDQRLILPFTISYITHDPAADPNDKNRLTELKEGKSYSIVQVLNFFKNIRSKPDFNGSVWTGEDVVSLLGRVLDLEDRLKYGQTTKYKFEFQERKDLIITGMTGSFTTKMADIPLEGHMISTKQFMGRSNWSVNLNLQTSNQNMLKILSTFSRRAALSRLIRDKSNMNWFIYKGHGIHVPPDIGANGFFKMLGINNVLVEGFEYSTMDGKPGWWNISIRLVQADMNIADFEKLLPWTQMYDSDVLDEVIFNCMKRYKYDDPKKIKYDDEASQVVSYVLRSMRHVLVRFLLNIGYGFNYDSIPSYELSGSDNKEPWNYGDLETYFRTHGQGALLNSEDKSAKKIYNDWGSGAALYDVFSTEVNDLYLAPYMDKLIDKFPKPKSDLDKAKVWFKERIYVIYDYYHHFVRAVSGLLNIKGLTSKSSINIMNSRLRRIENDFVSLTGIANIPVTKNKKDLLSVIIKQYIKQIIVKALSINRKAILEFAYAGDLDKVKYADERLVDSFAPNYAKDIKTSKLYGSYPDLEMPFTRTSLVLPSDFYYIKPNFYNKDDDFDKNMKNVFEYLYTDARKEAEFIYNIEAIQILHDLDPSGKNTRKSYKFNRDWIEKVLIFDTDIWSSIKGTVKGVLKGKDKTDRILQKLYEAQDKGTIELKPNADEVAKMLSEFKAELEKTFNITGKGYLNRPSSPNDMDRDKLLKLLKYHNYITETDNGNKNTLFTKLGLRALSIMDGLPTSSSVVKKGFVSERQREFLKIIFEMQQVAELTGPDIYNWGVSTPYNIARTAQIYEKCRKQLNDHQSRDNTAHLGRAFPTAKIFFIEEDATQWGMLDDYYMYNSIQSINVISAKGSASKVANIKLSNLTGSLRRKDSVFEFERVDMDSTRSEQKITDILLREGTVIMVKMGYDNNPGRLKTVFIGRIVSVELGDNPSIVAQSFGAGLQESVNDGMHKNFGASNKAVTHGDVLIQLMGNMKGLANFGNTSYWEKIGIETTQSFLFASPKSRLYDMLLNSFPVLDFYFKFQTYDPRFENIYLPYTMKEPGVAQTLGRVAGDIGSFFTRDSKFRGWTLDWTVNAQDQAQSLWDVMNEMALYRNNHIVTTLLYNEDRPGLTRETIYFGPKDGVYRYTDLYDQSVKDGQITRIANRAKANLSWRHDLKLVGKKFNNPKTTMHDVRFAKGQRDALDDFKDQNDTIGSLTSSDTLFTNATANASYVIHYLIKSLDFLYAGEPHKPMKDILEIYQELIEYYNGEAPENFRYKFIDIDFFKNLLDSPRMHELGKSLNKYLSRNKLEEIKNSLDRFNTSEDRILKEHFSYEGSVVWNKYIDDKEGIVEYFQGLLLLLKEAEEIDSDIAQLSTLPTTIHDRAGLGDLKDIGLFIDNPHDLYDVDKNNNYILEKGYKPLQDYHYVDSFYHIIKNNIRASSEELYNNVVVKYPKDPKGENINFKQSMRFAADDDIRQIKTYVTTQINIDPPPGILTFFNYLSAVGIGDDNKSWRYGFPKQAVVGYNVLANVMRPMYRGELVIVGNPNIKPYDIIFIRDLVNDMWGPIEVDEVMHKYSQDGFITIITPHAIVEPLNPQFKWEIEAQDNFFTLGLSKFMLSFSKEMLISAVIVGGMSGITSKFSYGVKVPETYKAAYYKVGKKSQYLKKYREMLRAKGTGPKVTKFLVEWKRKALQKVIDSGKHKSFLHKLAEKKLITEVNAIKTHEAILTKPGLKLKGFPGGDIIIEPEYFDKMSKVGGVIPIATESAKYKKLGAVLNFAAPTALLLALKSEVYTGVALALAAGSFYFGHSLLTWTIGEMLGRDCIDVISLWHHGTPFVAGIEGMQKNTLTVHWLNRVSSLFHTKVG